MTLDSDGNVFVASRFYVLGRKQLGERARYDSGSGRQRVRNRCHQLVRLSDERMLIGCYL